MSGAGPGGDAPTDALSAAGVKVPEDFEREQSLRRLRRETQGCLNSDGVVCVISGSCAIIGHFTLCFIAFYSYIFPRGLNV